MRPLPLLVLALVPAPAPAASLAPRILVPGPPHGPYDVAMKVQSVTDPSRPQDAYLSPSVPASSPSAPRTGRRLLFSVFMPLERERQPARGSTAGCPKARTRTVPYMTPLVAAEYGAQAAQQGLPRDLFARFGMAVCEDTDTARRPRGRYPVVLFTPGLQESRLLYGAGARSLASRGLVVVTVDHPLEASFVEFPDGTVIRGRDMSADEAAVRESIVEVRTADLSFVIDQLHNRTVTASLLGPLSAASLDLSQLVVYGHSLGGSAAASLARTDSRVRAGINLDGQIVGAASSFPGRGLDKPFLLAGRYSHSAEDATWDQFWPRLRGPRLEVAINGTAHASFTDRPLLVSALDLPESALKPVEGLIGSIGGRRLESIVNDVLVGFMDYVFHRRDGRGLGSLTEKYAQVLILRSNV
ncbi:hypothetical protein E4U41_005659 [Claviceps citrina]|nr:hypothetical protein E4U41_005659 [Claviceps citrina]